MNASATATEWSCYSVLIRQYNFQINNYSKTKKKFNNQNLKTKGVFNMSYFWHLGLNQKKVCCRNIDLVVHTIFCPPICWNFGEFQIKNNWTQLQYQSLANLWLVSSSFLLYPFATNSTQKSIYQCTIKDFTTKKVGTQLPQKRKYYQSPCKNHTHTTVVNYKINLTKHHFVITSLAVCLFDCISILPPITLSPL